MIRLLRVLLGILAITSALSFFSKPNHEDYSKNLGHPWEEYDTTYFKKFQSIQSIIDYADLQLGNKRNSIEYYNLISEIVRKRFYHGYSRYQFSDNPLAYLSGRFAWAHLSSIVIPDDIMKHPMAACSQQSIVLAAVFKRNKIDYRKVSYRGHFALEGFIANKWHYFDPDMEPKLTERESLHKLIETNKLVEAYAATGLHKNELDSILNTPETGRPNEALAPNATTFHQTCAFVISKWFLLFAFILTSVKDIRAKVLRQFFKKRKERKMETESPLAMAG